MLLFRSEEEAIRAGGEAMSVTTLQRLAERWYGDRLDPGWRPRTREASQRVLARAGLAGDFWRLG